MSDIFLLRVGVGRRGMGSEAEYVRMQASETWERKGSEVVLILNAGQDLQIQSAE